MGLNDTPNADRIHISFFGMRNAGKSSVVNALTGQSLSIVSDIKGTTTDPVSKAMELLPLGPVLITDTPGFDDFGKIGSMRVKKAKQVLNKTDVAVLVVDSSVGLCQNDKDLIELFKKKNILYIIAFNKCDIKNIRTLNENEIAVSAKENINIYKLKELIGKLAKEKHSDKTIISHMLSTCDIVILVTPIDESAPKGRIILPQVKVIRDILDAHAIAVTVQTGQLKETLSSLKEKPKLVITDSQDFNVVKDIVPTDIPLTSFSVLFANFKGILKNAVKGAFSLSELDDNDTVLICEGCTHHRQCNDIGTVKLPEWIKNFTKKQLNFEFTSGLDYVDDLSRYKLIIHCGGCMLNEREVMYRMNSALDVGIPFTNYGTVIAHINGILKRSIEIFNFDNL
ncbi:MAG: [FeFe] hydrogenase H-cluster maturation GTPase HydF [Clostridia bacterium]|nr:[FeFe] hydrogenase H-cluster maturation GTPase HydF [Clostridia bacterium]